MSLLPDKERQGQAPQMATTALIVESLRNAIRRGQIKAGEPLRQDRIATQFGVSHIPVREAFRQLVAEGLAVGVRNRGVVVSKLTPDEVWELTELRQLLEVQLARWAVENISRADIERAEAVLRELDTVREVDDILRLNALFHKILYERAGRPRVLSMIDSLRTNLERYLRMTWLDLNYLPDSQAEHRELLELFRAGEAEKIANHLTNHIAATGRLIVSHLSRQ